MLFTTTLFAIFFVVFFVVYHFVTRTRGAKLWAIVVGSAIFYGAWDYRYVPLLFGTALVDFALAKAMDRQGTTELRRKQLLIVSIALNLGVLAFFKYFDFFSDTMNGLLRTVGALEMVSLPTFGFILPVGISFYTFQSMSYTIDVYRRELDAKQNAVDFLAAVSFFPHLVAGPIIRASTLLPQFKTCARPTSPMVREGILLIGTGLLKKSLGDLAAVHSDRVFSSSQQLGTVEAWSGVNAFMAQIYADFSGYTDIAIGTALLLGFIIPKNFNLPFIAHSPSDFWSRWHISLSTWVRDYVFIPLGGSRHHAYRNTFVTMTLVGLWHGANWTFILYGACYGVLLGLESWVARKNPGFRAALQRPATRVPAILFTYFTTATLVVLFRATSVGHAGQMYSAMFGGSWMGQTADTWRALGLSVLAVIVGHVISYVGSHALRLRESAFLWPAFAACLAATMILSDIGQSFIYFQF